MAKSINYSHPVLGNSDDFTIEWSVETYDEAIPPQVEGGAIMTRICIECIRTGEQAIDSLLENDDATLFIEVKCLNTCYRRWFSVAISEDQGHIDIPSSCLQGKVTIGITLEVTNQVERYSPEFISDFYPCGQVFSLKKGDILARHETEFEAGEKYLEQNLNTVSWIKYRQAQEEYSEPQISYNSTDVVIDLPFNHYRFISEGPGRVDALIRCIYIAPVLAQCIEKVRQYDRQTGDDDIGDCDWVESLRLQMNAMHIEEDHDPVSTAWKILAGSLDAAVDELNSYMEDE